MGIPPRARPLAAWILWLLVGSPVAAQEGEVSLREALGWRLFFDSQLSRPGTYSCASCHQPAKGFADGLTRAHGSYGDVLRRHTPRLANLAAADALFWDGRAGSLEEQALVPLTHPQEMDLTAQEIVARVSATAAYVRAFDRLGTASLQIHDVVGALAAFVRSLRTGETAYDRWLEGEPDALEPAQNRGRMIFFTRGQCATCHLGPDLTDHAFHNIATGTAADPGRFEVTRLPRDRGRFKTPSLRNWRGTAPFLHDGRFATLQAVIEHYSHPPTAPTGESELDPLDLSLEEQQDLVAFLEALNGSWPDLSVYETVWELGGVDPP